MLCFCDMFVEVAWDRRVHMLMADMCEDLDSGRCDDRAEDD